MCLTGAQESLLWGDMKSFQLSRTSAKTSLCIFSILCLLLLFFFLSAWLWREHFQWATQDIDALGCTWQNSAVIINRSGIKLMFLYQLDNGIIIKFCAHVLLIISLINNECLQWCFCNSSQNLDGKHTWLNSFSPETSVQCNLFLVSIYFFCCVRYPIILCCKNILQSSKWREIDIPVMQVYDSASLRPGEIWTPFVPQ